MKGLRVVVMVALHQTAFVLDGLKARTDARIVGFYRPSFENGRNCQATSLRWIVNGHEDGSLTMPMLSLKTGRRCRDWLSMVTMFASLFSGGSSLKTDDGNALSIRLLDGAKVAQIRSAFKKGSKGKIKSRVLLKKFIETIA